MLAAALLRLILVGGVSTVEAAVAAPGLTVTGVAALFTEWLDLSSIDNRDLTTQSLAGLKGTQTKFYFPLAFLLPSFEGQIHPPSLFLGFLYKSDLTYLLCNIVIVKIK